MVLWMILDRAIQIHLLNLYTQMDNQIEKINSLIEQYPWHYKCQPMRLVEVIGHNLIFLQLVMELCILQKSL